MRRLEANLQDVKSKFGKNSKRQSRSKGHLTESNKQSRSSIPRTPAFRESHKSTFNHNQLSNEDLQYGNMSIANPSGAIEYERPPPHHVETFGELPRWESLYRKASLKREKSEHKR
jgi:hypothetical protein